MSAQEPSRKIRTPIWMRVALFASLAVNLLIVGVVLGAVIGRDRDGGPADRIRAARDLAPPPFVLALEPEDRRALVREFREAAPKRQSRDEVRARIQSILRELRAEEFDADTLSALLVDQRNQGLTRQSAGADVFVRHLSNMPAEARRAYADRLESTLRRGGKR